MLRKRTLFWVFLVLFLSGCLPKNASPAAIPTETPVPITATTTLTPMPTATPLPLNARKLPYLIMTDNPASLKVCWQFDAPTDAVLDWGTDDTYSTGSVAIPAAAVDGPTCAGMGNLQSGTHYLYRLSSRGSAVSSSFTTAPAEEDANLVFWGYGDTQANPEVHNAIAAAILGEMGDDPARQTFVFDAGDIMNEASEESLQANEFDQQWPAIVRLSSRVPVVNAMGNHDGTLLFIKYYPYPYNDTFDWSFDYGPVHFVVIDVYSGLDENSPRWQWLRDDLAASTKEWKFILLHEPGWSAGPHENNEAVQKILHPIAYRYGVSIVFSGHNHYYARAEVDGITYLTTGGGGEELYDPEYGWPNIVKKVKAYHYLRVEVHGSDLTVSALSPDGELLDQFQNSQ